MRTTPPVIGFTIALGLTGIGVVAQENPEPGSLEAYRAKCAATQCFLSGEVARTVSHTIAAVWRR